MAKKRRKGLVSTIQLKPNSDGMITVAVLGLMIFGSIMIMSTDVGQTTTSVSGLFLGIVKQIVFVLLGYEAMCILSKTFQFRKFSSRHVIYLFLLSGAMMLPFAFAESGGSHAWIRLPGGITVQPAEFLKPYIVLSVANACYQAKKNRNMLKNVKSLYRAPFIAMLLFFILLLLQKDLGTLVILFVSFFVCLIIPNYPAIRRFQRVIIAVSFVLLFSVIGLFWLTDIGTDIVAKTPFAHVATRISNAKNPYNDVYGEGYQPANSLYGIGSSNVVGKGIGGSARKYGYLTQADNDYILAVVIEETGMFGFGLIFILYVLLIGRMFYYAFRTNEVVYKVVLGGMSTYIFMHFALNVGGVTALIPFTGVPLLFISSGGSSLISVCIAIGISQSCICRIRAKEM